MLSRARVCTHALPHGGGHAAGEKEMAMNDCLICGAEYAGFGNNAAPLIKGRCCDDCNEQY
jgi:hypothetical protein